jgi:hypothetical protein
MNEIIRFALLGLGVGALYAFGSQGLIVIYRGTGVLNFSLGATAIAGVFMQWELQYEQGWPFLASAVVGVALSALLGALTHWVIMRPLRRASSLVRVIATLGVLIASDHGDMLGDHDKWHKMMPEHPALSVPLIFAGPGIQPLAVIDQPVDLVDVAATLLDLAEVTVPVPLAGQVLTPWLRGGVVEPDIPFRTAGLGQWRALFDGRYKYIHNYSPVVRMGDIVTTPWNPAAGAPATLYDLYEDPEERINLAAAQPQQARRLRELLLENAG